LALFIAGKAFFFSMVFVVPMIFHAWWIVLAYYMLTNLINGVVLSTVFQLAHCVEEADFPMPNEANTMETHWAVHQIETTVDFARRSRVPLIPVGLDGAYQAWPRTSPFMLP